MKKTYTVAIVAVAALAVSACATKRYPMETELSEAEIQLMDCRDLQREQLRTENVRRQIAETSQLDWRSGAAFIADFGIGNAMAKSEAESAIERRTASIRRAQASKNCQPA